MDQTNNVPAAVAAPKRQFKAFWPLMIIFVVAVIVGGLITWFKFELTTDYDLQSMVLTVHRRFEKNPLPVKSVNTQTATSSKPTGKTPVIK